MNYVEGPSDADFSAFLASLTPGKVLKDRQSNFTKVERKRQAFLIEKSKLEERRRDEFQFTPRQIEIAQRALASRKSSEA